MMHHIRRIFAMLMRRDTPKSSPSDLPSPTPTPRHEIEDAKRRAQEVQRLAVAYTKAELSAMTDRKAR